MPVIYPGGIASAAGLLFYTRERVVLSGPFVPCREWHAIYLYSFSYALEIVSYRSVSSGTVTPVRSAFASHYYSFGLLSVLGYGFIIHRYYSSERFAKAWPLFANGKPEPVDHSYSFQRGPQVVAHSHRNIITVYQPTSLHGLTDTLL
jgi:hypothetical protein